jgi:V/A-type H+-transporting ATPase subunit F
MSKVGFIGTPDTAPVFRPIGVDVAEVTDAAAAEAALERMGRGDHVLVLLEEDVARGIAGAVERAKRRPSPVLSLVPGVRGSRGTTIQAIRKLVERAVGADILFKGEDVS